MIGKVIRGANVRRLLYYLYGPGKANEHTDPRLVAGFGDPAELEPDRLRGGRRDFRRLTGLLNQPLAALNGDNYTQPVWHCALRAAPEDRVLSDAEWAPDRGARHAPDRPGPGRRRAGGAVGRGPARRRSHPHRGHAGPPGPAPAGSVEQLPQAAPGVPGHRGMVRVAAHRRGGSHRREAGQPG